jgi:hypothetical protein
MVVIDYTQIILISPKKGKQKKGLRLSEKPFEIHYFVGCTKKCSCCDRVGTVDKTPKTIAVQTSIITTKIKKSRNDGSSDINIPHYFEIESKKSSGSLEPYSAK